MRNILEIKNLVVSYGGIEAVKGIDLKVEEGKIVTLIGSNGAGKSTTLKAVAGLVKPKSGEILLNGANLVGKSTDQIVSSGVTLVPEGRRVFENLTVAENLRIGAYLRKDSLADDLARVYDLFPRLKEREWQQAGTLSGGEQQMLAVGRALMAKPMLIMMDEPSLGLAPIVVRGIFEIIREINRQGITVLLIEQNANMALKIADWAYVMQTGTILMQGEGKELLENEEVAKARGAKIYARIRGWGQASDGYNVAVPHPEGTGVINAANRALADAGISADDVDYINAHATSTPMGDVAELKAVKSVFGQNKKLRISSTKAITGHGLSLAGVMEAAFCALALKRGFTPGSAHIENLDEAAEGLNIPRKTEFDSPKIALSLSSGFGGANTAIVMEAAE